MPVTNFVPTIWAAAVAEALTENSILAALADTQYEGEARYGNAVKITGVVPPAVTNYTGTTTAVEADSSTDTLPIDQKSKFDFYVDDVDKVQARGGFEAWTTAAGRAMGEVVDSYIMARLIAGGTNATVGLGGTTHLNTDADGVKTWNAIRDLRKTMNKAKIPQGERYLIMNAEAEARLLGASAKLTEVDKSGTPAGLREATVGRILGFTAVTSNASTVVNFPLLVALWRPALAFVSQLEEVEAMRAHDRFADRIRGLNVYGAKVVSQYAAGVQFYQGAAT